MIEALHLDGTWDFEYCPMEKFKFLSAIRFQHLHSLSLNGIQLGDGSCLLPVRFNLEFDQIFIGILHAIPTDRKAVPKIGEASHQLH